MGLNLYLSALKRIVQLSLKIHNYFLAFRFNFFELCFLDFLLYPAPSFDSVGLRDFFVEPFLHLPILSDAFKDFIFKSIFLSCTSTLAT